MPAYCTHIALRIAVAVLFVSLAVCPVWAIPAGEGSRDAAAGRMWEQLISGAGSLRLPVGFLKAIPSDFVHFEFDDLRTYAAEYHPGEHRMVLNRTLSFHAAGRDLRSLKTMTSKELEVLYHELFHAYMDFLESREGEGRSVGGISPDDLLVFAREMQVCRYREVAITPVVQRSQETEVRYLSDAEAWEALNETWAVFVGWAVWNQLELEKKGGRSMLGSPQLGEQWVARFQRAMESGELRGYYVPQDPEERRVTQKRFLAFSDRISVGEAMRLMKQVVGLPDKLSSNAMESVRHVNNFQTRHQCASDMLSERKK
ncbi:hypothetical protein [Nitrospira sp. NS4]|uniref:hypothetical protein n=1 Tax=Nitrospira sp. NS4 TaxID=3414498 RepID=UPI003C2CC59C